MRLQRGVPEQVGGYRRKMGAGGGGRRASGERRASHRLRTRAGYFGATRREMLKNAIELAASGDDRRLNWLIASGAVFPVPGGMEVVVVEGGMSGVVKLRGDIGEFWTVVEAVGGLRSPQTLLTD